MNIWGMTGVRHITWGYRWVRTYPERRDIVKEKTRLLKEMVRLKERMRETQAAIDRLNTRLEGLK